MKSFADLPVYRETYQASLAIMTKIVPYLTGEGSEEMIKRLSNIATSIPRLIAGAVAVPQDRQGKKACAAEAIRGCHEAMVMLSHCRDLYPQRVNSNLCRELIDIYGRSSAHLVEAADKRRKT